MGSDFLLHLAIMRIAAIDCGSNSFHLLIADALGHDQLSVIEDDKTLLYLGAEVASLGSISPASLLRARRVMRHYKSLITRHNVDVVHCVATSAIRSAKNGSDVIDTLSKTLGHPVRVISGEEEAQTIFRAISAVSTLPESRVLACDMGGGSLELMAGQRYGLEGSISVSLGASRVARELKVSDPLTTADIDAIKHMCETYFEIFSHQYPSDLFSHIVASSGTLTTLITMARAQTDGYVSGPLSLLAASADEMTALCERIVYRTPDDRRNLLGYDNARDEFITTAAVIALEIAQLVSAQASWMISPYALREGIIFRVMDEADEYLIPHQSAVAQRTVVDLERRMNAIDDSLTRHGQRVHQLALILFDSLTPLHKLSLNDRTLLGFAARLHDIGEMINHSKHDQHGAYMLSSIPLIGFAPDDAMILRGIIRWHRTRDPRQKDRFVGRMSDIELERAQWLTAILRVADGADAGKSDTIDTLSVSLNPDVIFIRCRSSKDCELEMYSARRKRKLLESITHRDVVIEQELSNPQAQD